MSRGERGAAGATFAIVVVVVAAVLAAAFFGVDRYVHGRIESETAARLQTELTTPDVPTVEVDGWPVLTQLAGRRIGQVHVVADDLGGSGQGQLEVRHLDLTAHDLTTTDWWRSLTIGRVDGTALVDYAVVAQRAGVPLSYVGNGRFSVSGSKSLAGVTVAGEITWGLALDVDKQEVSLTDPSVEVAGYTLPDVVAQRLVEAVVRPVPVGEIPFGLRASSIDARDDGLHVGLEGADIPVQR